MSDTQQPSPPAGAPLVPLSKKEAKAQAAAARAYQKSQRNWFARHKILTGLAALIVLIIVISASTSGGGDKSVPAAADQANSITSAPPAAASAAPAPAAAPKTLLAVSGNGAKTTQKFTAAGDWDLAYSYDCSKFGTQGNFMVMVYGNDGQPSFSNSGPNELGLKGADVTHMHNGGTYYLEVNSECQWTMKVTG